MQKSLDDFVILKFPAGSKMTSAAGVVLIYLSF